MVRWRRITVYLSVMEVMIEPSHIYIMLWIISSSTLVSNNNNNNNNNLPYQQLLLLLRCNLSITWHVSTLSDHFQQGNTGRVWLSLSYLPDYCPTLDSDITFSTTCSNYEPTTSGHRGMYYSSNQYYSCRSSNYCYSSMYELSSIHLLS